MRWGWGVGGEASMRGVADSTWERGGGVHMGLQSPVCVILEN